MAYRGVFGAFPYAARASDSWLFRSYALVSVVVGGGLALLFAFGLVVLVAQTAAITGGSLTLSRAFYVVVGLFIVAPVIAPTPPAGIDAALRRGTGARGLPPRRLAVRGPRHNYPDGPAGSADGRICTRRRDAVRAPVRRGRRPATRGHRDDMGRPPASTLTPSHPRSPRSRARYRPTTIVTTASAATSPTTSQ